ncbi:MAG: EAL domain-containing protein [Rhodoplanes sp.]|uniref:putative bifunctional diguanylate cyclase/phosphodiesterase n=1 Tax=Rhodoplanes sp. TaxID=1968906 RepID=UPI0017D30572|nr:EAL domain-containing protein [Rhodoplanes sp.]NVO16563.1 EAL domain-containing protein [Rhodoplanes sp.]
MPSDVLAELIDSLYAPIGSLVVGWSCSILIGVIVSARTGSAWLAAITAALALIAAARGLLVVSYRSRPVGPDTDLETLRRWEWRWLLGAWVFAGTLGGLCFVCFVQVDDPVAHLLVDATTIGYTAGATTRNAGRPRIAVGQIALTLAPISLGALLHGGSAYLALAVVTGLYFVAAAEIAVYLGNRSLRHLMANREKTALAHSLAAQNLRFDAALSNMSHGLCMFDRRGRLAVSNRRMCELYGLPPGTFRPGMSVRDMLQESVAAGNHPGRSLDEMTVFFEQRLAGGMPSNSKMELAGGRTILLSQWPITDGGSVVLFEDVTERERAEARAQWLATHDELTGLPNRTLFSQTLEETIAAAQTSHQRFAVMFLDLDRFKFVNDTLGHTAGDTLLKEVAARLARCVDPADVVSRLGGDEFIVLLRRAADEEQARTVARAILAAVVAPIVVLGQECRVSVSIGVAFYPIDGLDEQTLARNADAAMYLAKDEGRSCVRMFTPAIEGRSIERLMLETSLRGALERNELVLHYQPKRRLATGAVSGAEALLRWRHPELGMLAPGRFIPLAEETGLIVPIGRWVLAQACLQSMAWQRQGLAPLRVAVNLSPRQFADESLLGDIEQALAESGLPPDLLELEITESMVMQNLARALPLLAAVRTKGIHLAIDDFGTGYSSMALVKQFPIDTIKIDRVFVRDVLTDPEDKAIAEAIVALGKALDLTIVAEGVETEAQEAFLRERACDEMQGFLFSRPLPADELAAFVGAYELSRLKALAATIAPTLRPASASRRAHRT